MCNIKKQRIGKPLWRSLRAVDQVGGRGRREDQKYLLDRLSKRHRMTDRVQKVLLGVGNADEVVASGFGGP